jgi:hypothetical protein
MSMIGCLKRATDEQIAQLLADPRLIEPFVHGPEHAVKPPAKIGFIARLLGAQPREPAEKVELPPDWPDEQTDLDKAWHGIHFLLTATDWEGDEPLCYLVRGGKEVGDIDVGYGPARALESAQVKRFSDALAQVSEANLRARFDADKLTSLSVYPTIWNEGDEALEYLLEYFRELKSFVDETAQKRMGLVVWLS